MDYYYFRIGFTVILIILLTLAAFAIDFIGKTLERMINPKYVNITVILLLLLFMVSGSYGVSRLGNWSFIDTVFILSLCFFGMGWMTNITNKASRNSAGTAAKFITNNEYKHQYEAASSSGVSLYFISSLVFLIGSWGIAFLLAFT
ncbi:hypothetical protein QTG56_00840 [Rossellomorea sp. AcN35-11]|nr:hypothetical protein [Rossellomorea aquimaris]WJV29749.1 hypothetical protein QTG56_00840 [Rossellomorea sp. AcN35-11]